MPLGAVERRDAESLSCDACKMLLAAVAACETTQTEGATFTYQAIASAGLTDAQVGAEGYTCDCRVLPLEYVPRALVNRDTRGLIKLVADASTGRLLGAHVLAEGAGDVIATAVYALANQMTVQQMADLWCPYLTMAAQTYTRDVSKLSCCAS